MCEVLPLFCFKVSDYNRFSKSCLIQMLHFRWVFVSFCYGKTLSSLRKICKTIVEQFAFISTSAVGTKHFYQERKIDLKYFSQNKLALSIPVGIA